MLVVRLLLLVTIAAPLFAQSSEVKNTDHRIEIAVDKRVYLIFPSSIYKFDWSETDSIAVTKDENKILINSFGDNIADSNLLVETMDGFNYSFLLVVRRDIKELKYVIRPEMSFFKRALTQQANETNKADTSAVQKSPEAITAIRRIAKEVENTRNEATGLATVDNKISFVVGGIFVHGDHLYFKVLLQNESNVPYDIDFIAFVIQREKGKIKRTAVQGPEPKKPEYILNESVKTITKDNIATFVFVFDKFTYDKKEKLYIEFWEKKGDRNIRIAIPSKAIINAKDI